MLILVAGLLGCSRDVEPVAGDAGLPLPPDRVSRLEGAARSGDVAAANTLAVHYSHLGDTEHYEQWLVQAVSLGDCAAVEVLGDSHRVNRPLSPARLAEAKRAAAKRGCSVAPLPATAAP